MTFGTNDVSPPGCVPCGQSSSSSESNDEEPPHWIEIELVYEDNGDPVPHEEYLIELPDQSEVRGFTDAQGIARIKGLDQSGQAKICFPRVHEDEWKGS